MMVSSFVVVLYIHIHIYIVLVLVVKVTTEEAHRKLYNFVQQSYTRDQVVLFDIHEEY